MGIFNIGIERIKLKFFPKYQLLIGINIMMHETMDVETKETYDGIDIDFGIGIILFTMTLLKSRKGAQ